MNVQEKDRFLSLTSTYLLISHFIGTATDLRGPTNHCLLKLILDKY